LNFRFGLTLGAFCFEVRGLSGRRAFGCGAQFEIVFKRLTDDLQARARLIRLAVDLLEAVQSEGGAHGLIINQKPVFSPSAENGFQL
jgi:hypothetical protein